jgi:serine/threonine protein kinase
LLRVKDVDLLGLSGTLLESPDRAGVTYRLERQLGQGAQGVVYAATQRLADAESVVVVKIMKPRALRELAGLGANAIGKEVAALQRLSNRVPPVRNVVKFFDTGTIHVGGATLGLPWVAVEYVDGGEEGTTLRSRVAGSLERSGAAFDLERAGNAIRCITAGIEAIHDAGVIHRDVNPGNVLCCGAGDDELFKIADFGLARVSTAATFGNVLLGTPGYCAPEQSFPDKIGVGPHTDVFGMACTVFFLLTGEHYFPAPTVPEMLVAVYGAERKKLGSSQGLPRELRNRDDARAALDALFSRATHADPLTRPRTAREFGEACLTSMTPRGQPA